MGGNAFVIAQAICDFDRYARALAGDGRRYAFVGRVEDLVGQLRPEVHCIGTYYRRADWPGLVEALRACSAVMVYDPYGLNQYRIPGLETLDFVQVHFQRGDRR
jgi:hypothetical protein